MATDRELWALTLMVERDHGQGAPRYIAEKIGAAAIAGDWTGVAMWKGVAARFDQLKSQPSSGA
ncbi:DUF6961 family protein [Sphingomonas sp. Leaf37]|uniref:DUF6961 family protein n=1 Tax=Sphingomonas sp. Leaf37 TaxID=2876552 RepID=UPI001E5C38A8|nr:hypothetical protein [Sphingomonas sp. Leaf37]